MVGRSCHLRSAIGLVASSVLWRPRCLGAAGCVVGLLPSTLALLPLFAEPRWQCAGCCRRGLLAAVTPRGGLAGCVVPPLALVGGCGLTLPVLSVPPFVR